MRNEEKAKMLIYILKYINYPAKTLTVQISTSLHITIISCLRKKIDSVCIRILKGVVV